MQLDRFARRSGHRVRRDETDDGAKIVVDFGPEAADASADVVDGTVIVVLDDEDQHEIDLPESDVGAHTFMRNGVLTIELEAPA